MSVPARRLTAGGREALEESVAEEVAVALVYNGISHAVMMATPCDLEDFARGFSLTERIVETPSEIYDVEVEPVGRGIEVRLEIAAQADSGSPAAAAQPGRTHRLRPVRRRQSGRGAASGPRCREPAIKKEVSRQSIERAMAALPGHQQINRSSGATHAAGWASADGVLVCVREDVGRHENALDKLAGALARSGAAEDRAASWS